MSSSARSGDAGTAEAEGTQATSTVESVRAILKTHGCLSVPMDDLGDTTDLHSAGLTSLATVSLMLALEERFNVEFPDALLSRKTFSSVNALAAAIDTLRSSGSAR